MKRLGTIFTICGITAAIMIAATTSSSATTWYVSTSGNDGNSGTSQSSAFATLGKAVSVVNAGDTVDVDSGTFAISSPVVITRSGSSGSPITIQTTLGYTQAVLNGNGVSGGLGDVIDVEANYITINNFTIEGGGTSNFEDVDLYTGSHCTLENSTLEYGYWGGADISRYSSNTQVTDDHITGCVFYDNSTVNTNQGGSNWGGGVGLNNCTYSSITGCTVYDNWGEGLTVAGTNTATSNNTVTGNTVYDNYSIELYLNATNGATVANNLIYSTGHTYDRTGQGQAAGIESDNELGYFGVQYYTGNCNIYNNIVIGGAWCFRYANTNTYSGFANGGMNGYNIYNNDFYSGPAGFNDYNGTPNVDIHIDNDSGNNFTWRNNLAWQTNNGTDVADDGGGGTQTLSNDCWDYSGGGNSMSGSNDITDANTNPGVAGGSNDDLASYWKPTSGSGLNSSGYNAYSLFTYDYANSTRPSSGAWSIGAFIAYSSGGGSSDLVQETYNDSASSGSSVSQAYASSQTSGDLNVVVIGYNSTSATVSSVTDSQGNTYHVAVGPTVGSLATQYIYYASGIKSGSNTVTVNMSGTVSYPDLRIAEYKNVAVLDKTAGASGNSASPNSGSVTTTAANEVLVGACNSGPGVTGEGAGYSDLVVTSPDGDAIEDDTVTSTGSYSASVTQSSGNWVMQLATFKATPTPAFVQVNSNDPTSDTTVTCAYNSSQTAGDLNVVVVGSNSTGAAINSVTDSAGNTYTKAVGITTSGGTMQAIYYASNIKSGSNTVSVTFNSSVSYPDIRVLEYSGVSAVDKTAANSGTSNAPSTSSVSTSYANEVLFMADTCYPTTTGVGSGYTTRVTTTDGNVAADHIVSSTGSYSASATLNNSNYWVIQLVTFH